MRRIIVFDHVTVDGYFAAEDGNLDWVVSDEELTQSNLQNMAEADTILFGRRTYEMFESFWPKAISDHRGAEDPHAKGRRSEATQKVGEWINNATKIVFSRTREAVIWQGSRVIREFSVAEIEALKYTAGKNMLLLGSGELTRLIARGGLIDEYRFGVVPVILGKGRKLLLDGPCLLSLVESSRFPSGTVLLRYSAALTPSVQGARSPSDRPQHG
jgi:dihydrofolate reductase